uniref:Rhodanese domain-containing protein n=1 Tax=Odontella aurita TaxID=265563 RepID=A0A7S4N641_9STRA
MLTLSLILLINNSSTTRALSSHRSCFVSRVSSPPQNRALSSVSLSLLGDLGRRSTTNNLHRTFLSSDSNEEQKPRLTNIGKTEMAKILAEVENGTGDENYVVIDVRGADEIMMGTGLMSSDVNILPLPEITNMDAFNMGEETFEAQFNFPKPNAEDTVVFTCKAGPRSQQAAQLAAMSGYKTIIVYEGGADDWFGGELFYT